MVIWKGSVCWVDFSSGKGSEPLGMRLGLVIQDDVLNDSNIIAFIMPAIISTLKFGELPGKVVLNKGESNLPRKCFTNVNQIKSIDKRRIKENIGTLSKKRLQEIDNGLKLGLSSGVLGGGPSSLLDIYKNKFHCSGVFEAHIVDLVTYKRDMPNLLGNGTFSLV